jgi:hypothetical protein
VGHVVEHRGGAVRRQRRGLDRCPVGARRDLQEFAVTPVDVEKDPLGVHELAHISQQSADDLVDRSGAGHPLRETVEVLEFAQALTQGRLAIREQHLATITLNSKDGRGDHERYRHQRHARVDGTAAVPSNWERNSPGSDRPRKILMALASTTAWLASAARAATKAASHVDGP